MSNNTAASTVVLTFNKVLDGSQPAAVVQNIVEGTTFSVPFEAQTGAQSVYLTTQPESNFTAQSQVELTLKVLVTKQVYVSSAAFNASVFGQDYPISLVALEPTAAGSWNSLIKFQGGCIVTAGNVTDSLVAHLRG